MRRAARQLGGVNYLITATAREDMARRGIFEKHFLDVLHSNTFIPVPEDKGLYWMLVFEDDPQQADRGYFVQGHVNQGHLTIEKFDLADIEDEIDYFKAVAEMHRMQPKILNLERGLFQCHTLVIKAATQVKLWLKHRLNPEDVADLFNNRTHAPSADRAHSRGGTRFAIEGVNRAGRMLRAVVGVEPDCNHTLVTAFEER